MSKEASSLNLTHIYNQLDKFSIRVCRGMWEQVALVGANTELLLRELSDDISSKQQKRLAANLELSNLLQIQIINYRNVLGSVIEFLDQSKNISFDNIDMHSLVRETLERLQKQPLREIPSEIAITFDEPVITYSVNSLLAQAINNFFVWIFLFSPHAPLSVSFDLGKNDVCLKVTGYDTSNPVEFIPNEAANVAKEIVEFVVSIVGGSFNWEELQSIPNKDELVICLPKKPVR